MLADSFQSPLTVIMLSCKIRTPCFLAFVLVLCSSIGEISTQSIDEIISSAANSSDQFTFIQDRDDSVIRTELDILYTREQWNEIIRLNNTIGRQKRKAIRNTKYRWTNNVIPYQISEDFSARDRERITASLNDWNSYTCLIFRPARHGDRNQIRMQNGPGCSSYVGMQGGTQIVSLGRGCRIKRIIIHELGHAIGFQHEQTRPDRDNYVSILLENIPDNRLHNFRRYSNRYVNSYRVSYDYTSVMHYGAYAFSYNGRRTIQTKDARYRDSIGKSPGLSFKDIKLANLMYNCAGRCGRKICPSPGYLDKKCTCMCPGPSPDQPIRKCSDCVDNNKSCTYWASIGECKKNPAYMLVYCKKSCKKCGDCVDNNKSCTYWASIGECKKNPAYMLVYCKKSCKKCGDCVDNNKSCTYWASIGECKKNPAYMLVYCKKSCKKCGDCVDNNKSCTYWASIGECKKNPAYMLVYCKKSCKKCGDCVDNNKSCTYWASIGECKKNPAYMLVNCKKSCNKCGGGGGGVLNEEPCLDSNEHCADLAAIGDCKKNPEWMSSNCKKSCNTCSSPGLGSVNSEASNDIPLEMEPCLDSNEHCADLAAIGDCKKNPEWMSSNCKKSCNTCSSPGLDSVNSEASNDIPLEMEPCLDSNEHCADLAAIGDCKKNPEWMSSNCKKSCNTCSSPGLGSVNSEASNDIPLEMEPCLDSNEHCADLAAIGDCKKNPEWMSSNCKKSCNTCSSPGLGSVNSEASNDIPLEMEPCLDSNEHCADLAAIGDCKKNPEWMSSNCKKSCNTCSSPGLGSVNSEASNDIPLEMEPCLDSNEHCADLAAIGDCKKNPEWMSSNCKKSCNTCSSPGLGSVNSEASNDIPLEMDLPCFDFHNSCPSWKTKEFCVSPLYKAFMTKNCRKSCGICE